MTAFALVLLLAAAAAWIACGGAPLRTRLYLRLAGVLYAALAVSEAFHVAPAAVTDIVATLGAAVLCIAAFAGFRRSPRWFSAAAVLVLAASCGIAAAANDLRALAAAPQLLCAIFTFLIARPGLWRRASVYLALASLSLLGAAALALAPGAMARAGFLLFAAAGVLGVALASDVLVDELGSKRHRTPVGLGR